MCHLYNINNRNSFEHIVDWFEECKNFAPITCSYVLVGNCELEEDELEDKREVTYDEGQKLADKLGISFFEASSLTGKNIETIFLNLQMKLQKK